MNKKSQAAMEFLMTYGWALLVVLMVIAALAYFGMLNPDRFLPDKVTVSDNRIQLIPTQSNGIIIKNVGSETLYNLQINMTNHDCKISAPNTIAPDEARRYIIICNEPMLTNGRLKGDIRINYSSISYGDVVQKTATAFYAVRGNYFSGNGINGYWPLDLDYNDYSGNGNHGTCTNCPAYLSSGKIGGTYSFDGSSTGISIGNSALLNTPEMSVSMWIKTSSAGTLWTFSRDISGGRSYTFGVNGGYIACQINGAGGCNDNSLRIDDNKWHHFVYVGSSSIGGNFMLMA
jgi:hypothetical protein